MSKHKVSELDGALLDAAVAKAAGLMVREFGSAWQHIEGCRHSNQGEPEAWCPSTKWDQGGPIIERERIEVIPYFRFDSREFFEGWRAGIAPECAPDYSFGQTPLIAAMRAYVISKLGEEIELP
jgi:hypothetical protein